MCYPACIQVKGSVEMSEWRDVHVGFEGDGVKISGIAVWQQNWRRTGEEAIQLPHPSYQHQRHRFDIYEVGPTDSLIRFAAGELSNGVWGFYIPA
ncbi:hypothetical protein BH10PLA2_BH10PLA2_01930 [soil metagenome]|jgi:hypothetical protein